MFFYANHWIKFSGFIISESRIKNLTSESKRYRHVCTTDFPFSKAKLLTWFVLTARAFIRLFALSITLATLAESHNPDLQLSYSVAHIIWHNTQNKKKTKQKLKTTSWPLTCDRCHFGFVNLKTTGNKLPTNTPKTPRRSQKKTDSHSTLPLYRIFMMLTSNHDHCKGAKFKS